MDQRPKPRAVSPDLRGKTQSAQYDALNCLLSVTTPPATATVCTSTCATDNIARTATVRWTFDGLEQSATDYNGTLKGCSYDSYAAGVPQHDSSKSGAAL